MFTFFKSLLGMSKPKPVPVEWVNPLTLVALRSDERIGCTNYQYDGGVGGCVYCCGSEEIHDERSLLGYKRDAVLQALQEGLNIVNLREITPGQAWKLIGKPDQLSVGEAHTAAWTLASVWKALEDQRPNQK